MFPHEEFLKKALEESTITPIVTDLGAIYVSMTVKHDPDMLQTALNVNKILIEAAAKIANLGPKPKFPHPLSSVVQCEET